MLYINKRPTILPYLKKSSARGVRSVAIFLIQYELLLSFPCLLKKCENVGKILFFQFFDFTYIQFEVGVLIIYIPKIQILWRNGNQNFFLYFN